MTAEQLKALIDANDINVLVATLDTHCLVNEIKDCIKQYLPEKHAVHDPSKRMDKIVNDDDGRPKAPITVARLSLPMQKNIVMLASAFIGVPKLDAAPEGDVEQLLFSLIEKTEEDNKIDYKFKAIVKHTKSEKRCAELWYAKKADQDYYGELATKAAFRFKLKTVATSLGDTLYPVFDKFGDMIAFGRKYEVDEFKKDGTKEKVEYLELYTTDFFYFWKRIGSGEWTAAADENTMEDSTSEKGVYANPWKKIPVIYYSQPYTEWHDVQCLIDRLETKISNHADTNDYYDSPIVFAEGDVEGFADKGEQGKLLVGKNGSKVSYLTWDSAPESMKMEIENLITFIGKFTHTPDISLDNLKGLGDFTGIALKMLFLDAHLKAADSEEVFGEGVQRRINFLKAAYAVLDPKLKPALKLKIKPKFTYFMPENIAEQVDILVKAANAKLISTESSVARMPESLVSDPENERKLLESEQKAADKREADKAKQQAIVPQN